MNVGIPHFGYEHDEYDRFSNQEKASFDDRSNLDEYNFRSDFCKSAVIENILPSQPGFTKAFKKMVINLAWFLK